MSIVHHTEMNSKKPDEVVFTKVRSVSRQIVPYNDNSCTKKQRPT